MPTSQGEPAAARGQGRRGAALTPVFGRGPQNCERMHVCSFKPPWWEFGSAAPGHEHGWSEEGWQGKTKPQPQNSPPSEAAASGTCNAENNVSDGAATPRNAS